MSNLITFGLGRGIVSPTGIVLYDLSVLRDSRPHIISLQTNTHTVSVTRTQYTLCNRQDVSR